MTMMVTDWIKAAAFRRYIRTRHLLTFRRNGKEVIDKEFAKILKRRADAIAEPYPDFPAAYEEYCKKY